MSFEIQNQVRQKTMQVHESIKGLKEFEAEMKKKELELKNQAEQKSEEQSSNKPPVRSKIGDFEKFHVESLQKFQSMNIDDDNKAAEEQTDACTRKREAFEFKDKGNAFVKGKDYEAAIKMYSRAIELCDDDAVFYSNRAQCFLSLEKLQECISDTNKAIQLDPKSSKSFYRRMVAYEKIGEDFKAMQSCRQLLELLPEDQPAKTAYDRIHNRIMEVEKKKDKEKIRWARNSPTADPINFVQKPPHLRSKRPLKNVPVRIRKAASPIPEAIIDKIFGNNTGENVPEPETDSKLFKPNFFLSAPPVKVAKLAEKPKNEPPVIIEDKKTLDETNEILKATESKKEQIPPLGELEAQKTPLISIPSTGPKFFAAWKELNDIQRFLYLKNIAEQKVPVGKMLGAQLNSEMLSQLIFIVHKYFIAYNLPFIQLLSDLGKNQELSVLAMFLEEEDKTMLNELLASSSAQGDNETNNQILEIKNYFQI